MHSVDQVVLIVEQDDLTRALYLRALSRAYRTFACSNEYDALDIARSQPLSAVIFEPLFANGQGWNLLVALREHLNAAVPIILCSTLDERRRGMLLGATIYLVKPVLPTLLLAHMERFSVHSTLGQRASNPTRHESML